MCGKDFCFINTESNRLIHCFLEMHMRNEATASEGLFISTDKLPVIFIASFIARVVFIIIHFRSVS